MFLPTRVARDRPGPSGRAAQDCDDGASIAILPDMEDEIPQELPVAPHLVAVPDDAIAPPDPSDIPPSQRGSRRRELLPAWVVITAAAIIALLLGAAAAVPAVLASRRVEVPDVTGLPVQTASDRLELAGFEVERGDERFSSEVPKGSVIEQTPGPGAEAAPGATILLVVSAGTDTFEMPDVVGKQLDLARQVLASRGLAIRIDVVPSETASGTVISTVPAPGARVTTSDVVRVTVAGTGQASSALLPYRLEGVWLAVDPSPVATGTLDVPMEVTRRLRALLEASGARVFVTRDARRIAPSAKKRAAIAIEATAGVVVGLDISTDGEGGLSVSTPPLTAERSRFDGQQQDLAQRIASELRTGDRIVKVVTTSDDVLSRVPAPGVRLHLGSTASREDEAAYRDPRWADEMARALYRAIGEVFGKK